MSAPACRGVVVIALALGACVQEEGDHVNEGSRADASPAAVHAWRLTDVPLLDLATAGAGGAYEFTRIIGAVRLSDGGIVAANFANPPDIRGFAPDGRHLWTVGGSGGGPGEFEAIAWIQKLRGDTIVAYDYWQSRLTFLSTAGVLLGVTAVERADARVGPGGLSLSSMFDDGSLLGRQNLLFPGAPRGEGRLIAPFLRVDRSGSTWDTIAVLESIDHAEGAEGRPILPLFGRSAVVMVAGNRMVHGMGDQFVFAAYDHNGVKEVEFRLGVEPRAVTPELLEQAERAQRSATAGAGPRANQADLDWRYREGPRAATVPAYDRFRAGGDGRIWVRSYVVPGDPVVRWYSFMPDGRPEGQLEVPAGLDLLHFATAEVLGVWTDSLDVQTPRLYGLLPR
ncbi:MAG: hypothetical protein R3E98_21330 [Gemmatimonadota bacterium]|nr:hypothetical protein [Gemmatimonadota bacterium]